MAKQCLQLRWLRRTTETTTTTKATDFQYYKQNRLYDALKIDLATYCFVIFIFFLCLFLLCLLSSSRSSPLLLVHLMYVGNSWHQTFDNVSVNMQSDDLVLLYVSVRSRAAATQFYTPSFQSLWTCKKKDDDDNDFTTVGTQQTWAHFIENFLNEEFYACLFFSLRHSITQDESRAIHRRESNGEFVP